ncbi:MAG: hypothetical protein Q9165_008310 [Trypethelium subeluteriae]
MTARYGPDWRHRPLYPTPQSSQSPEAAPATTATHSRQGTRATGAATASTAGASPEAAYAAYRAQAGSSAPLRANTASSGGSYYSSRGRGGQPVQSPVVMPREDYNAIMHRLQALEQWKRRQEGADDDDDEDSD